MAIANSSSAAITNRDASPVVANNPGSGGQGFLRSVYSLIASVAAALSATSILRIIEVPTNAIVESVKLFSGAQAAGAGDIGVYRNTADGGAVVDADFFGSAVSVAAAVNGDEVSHESTVYTLAKRAQPLWKAVGLTKDPGGTFDICFTVTTDITTGLQPLGISADFVE